MGLNNTCLILIIVIFIIATICLYITNTEEFSADFSFRQRRGTNAMWENAKIVIIKNIATNLVLTYVPRTGSVRLEPPNKSNPYQYWVYSSEGYIMQPFLEMCISYPTTTGTGDDGLRMDPLMNLCSEYAGQVFVYNKDSKRIVNRTQMPYYTINQRKLIKNQKMRCLSWYPTSWGIQRNLGIKRVAIVECRPNDKGQQWDLIEVNISEFEKAKKETYMGYTTITSSNNPRSLYPTASIGEFNTEVEYESLKPRPYFDTSYGIGNDLTSL